MTRGTVTRWNDDKGWGVLVSPDLPGEVFAHCTTIATDGYRALAPGDTVDFEWRPSEPERPRYRYVATTIRRVRG